MRSNLLSKNVPAAPIWHEGSPEQVFAGAAMALRDGMRERRRRMTTLVP